MRVLLIFMVFLSVTLSTAADSNKQDIIGSWEGAMDVGVPLRLVLHVFDVNGQLVATVDSPDQGAKGIPVKRIEFSDNTLRLSLPNLGARYRAKLSDGIFKGYWKQNGARLKLDLKPVDASAVRKRPQTPQKPFDYTAEEVVFQSVEKSVQLSGTLTLPKQDGPHRAVVLLSGSGPQDRDSTLFEHKPFFVIADYLTQRGFAVLRFDDRGVGQSWLGEMQSVTTESFVSDALGAVSFLTQRSDIREVGLIGHSEGALVADRVLQETKGQSHPVSWSVRLAGPAVDGAQVLQEQSVAAYMAIGGSQEHLAELNQFYQTVYTMAKSDVDDEALREQLTEFAKNTTKTMDASIQTAFGLNDGFQSAQIEAITSPWFRHFLRYDPAPTLADVNKPILALFGGKDVQVTAQQNLSVIEPLLKHSHSSARAYADLNHLFQRASSGSPKEYSQIEETFNEAVLEDIVEWLQSL